MVSGPTGAQDWFCPVHPLKLQTQRGTIHVMDSIHSTFRQAGLVRPKEGRVLAGVCAGLGKRIGIDPWPARLLFVLIMLIVPGGEILLVYPILWILMPDEAPAAAFIPVTPANGTPSAA